MGTDGHRPMRGDAPKQACAGFCAIYKQTRRVKSCKCSLSLQPEKGGYKAQVPNCNIKCQNLLAKGVRKNMHREDRCIVV